VSQVERLGSFGGSLHREGLRDLAIETASDDESRNPYQISKDTLEPSLEHPTLPTKIYNVRRGIGTLLHVPEIIAY